MKLLNQAEVYCKTVPLSVVRNFSTVLYKTCVKRL